MEAPAQNEEKMTTETNMRSRADTPAERVVYTGPIDACFGCRLGSYRYYDMDQVIAAAPDASGNR